MALELMNQSMILVPSAWASSEGLSDAESWGTPRTYWIRIRSCVLSTPPSLWGAASARKAWRDLDSIFRRGRDHLPHLKGLRDPELWSFARITLTPLLGGEWRRGTQWPPLQRWLPQRDMCVGDRSQLPTGEVPGKKMFYTLPFHTKIK